MSFIEGMLDQAIPRDIHVFASAAAAAAAARFVEKYKRI